MEYLSIASIEVRERIRTIDKATVTQLKESIRSKGIIHPIVIAKDPTPFLVAGEHRKIACFELHEEGIMFLFDGNPVPVGTIPCTNVFDLTPADLLELEVEENTVRVEVPWQDKARALAAIHELRVKANPSQTNLATAREIAAKTGANPVRLSQNVRNATILAQNMHRPSVAKARNATEALGILLKEEEAKLGAELIKRTKAAKPEGSSATRVIHGDMLEVFPTLDAGTVDLICADPPYGINADTGGFRSRTVEHHNYKDDLLTAKTVMQAILTEGFRVTKAGANLFMFGDVDLFPFFKEAAANMGWKPFRTPIIWQKSESEGLAPWGREGPRRTYEMIFFATKGMRGLHLSPTDILNEKRVGRAERRYGPEKPLGLMKALVECATMPGDLVLDPCCGSGSTLKAARSLNRRAIGIELDEGAYNLAVVAAEETDTPSPTPSTPTEELV